MICYIYWMAFCLACYVAWGEWWIRIPLLIIAGVFLFLANRKYVEQQRKIEALLEAMVMMAKCCEKESNIGLLQSKYLRKLWERVVKLEKQKESEEDAE